MKTTADVWNLIVKGYTENQNARESVIQDLWEQYFAEIFNYKKIFGEIDAQRSVHIGAGQRAIPDIILKKDEQDLFDVELKQYNMPFSDDMEKQLISYMNQLHISVGIVICQTIRVYVYHYTKPQKYIEIDFKENNPDGIKFVELFQKENFSVEKIESFIDSKKSFQANVEKIKKEITVENILILLESYFNSTYTTEELQSALKDIVITVHQKGSLRTEPIIQPAIHPIKNAHTIQRYKSEGMDYSKYIFEGRVYGKNRLVLAAVQAYVRDNPSVSYSGLKAVFYDKLQGSTGVVFTPDEAKQKSQDPEKRYFTKNPIFLCDGTIVWICSQWGIGNIGNFIKKARSLGYKIDKE